MSRPCASTPVAPGWPATSASGGSVRSPGRARASAARVGETAPEPAVDAGGARRAGGAHVARLDDRGRLPTARRAGRPDGRSTTARQPDGHPDQPRRPVLPPAHRRARHPSPTLPQVEGPPAPAQQAQRLPTSVVPEPPVAVRLPGGKLVGVVPTRTGADGSLGIPDNLRRAGWWRGGARLGDPFGSMLVAAHVDAIDRGLGPFVVLLSVGRGARFTVTSRHLTQTFQVTARRLIPRDQLAQARWVSSFSGAPRLTLVTCAPPYVRSKGGYQRLAVVVATPVGPPRARALTRFRACGAAPSAPSGRGPCAAPASPGTASASRSAPGWGR